MKVIDLFSGCGGLSLGFEQKGIKTIGFLDWDRHCIKTVKKNFFKETQTLEIDIRESFKKNCQETNLFLRNILQQKVNGIIGGPPCQSYSIAGRIRDPNAMKNDYRNFLFESYIKWLKKIKPNFLIFENVPGILSSKPGGLKITEVIKKSFFDAGYIVPNIDKKIVFNLADFGGPQNRKRLLIFGVNKKFRDAKNILNEFYLRLEKQFTKPSSVKKSIYNLPKLFPLTNPIKRSSHKQCISDPLHYPRFHNKRDINIFRMLAKDSSSKNPVYNIKKLKELYTNKTGKIANVHKYYVLKWEEPSNLIPAHLYKDGLRHIHPDYEQARTITPREAARLQTFPDTFKFDAPRTEIYKMIGNSVAPLFANKIAITLKSMGGNLGG